MFTGVYRQGFEQSDFYPDSGGGPWWLTAEEAAWTAIQAFKPQTGSRGDAAIVRIVAEGELRGPFDIQIRAPFANSIHITRLVSVEPVSDAVFQAAAQAAGARY